ncbi:MAG: hypothetical protein J6X19_00630, partial [Clostridia bacterium]|nr:hypothetical protein [Clostridia bacterium]
SQQVNFVQPRQPLIYSQTGGSGAAFNKYPRSAFHVLGSALGVFASPGAWEFRSCGTPVAHYILNVAGFQGFIHKKE